MFTPAPANVSNILAATPGFVFMPAPTMLTLPMAESVRDTDAPISSANPPVIRVRHCRGHRAER